MVDSKALPQEIIAVKRDGRQLSEAKIQQFVDGVVSGDFRDYQASALLMAILLKGMTLQEVTYLTDLMMRSGKIIELPEITRSKVDKHSTGGVGDKVSLILAPLAAAVGLTVPMMSGRGLGHTGGTLDKLEAIPGFNVSLSEEAYREQLLKIHVAMIGQSKEMVPADRKLYALRDVTGTVESVPLICASILSKKLAEGIDALVLDVKCGSGAFMKSEAKGRELAEALVAISGALGKPTSALLTRMDEPLGCAIGNSIEVIEAIECLKGNGPSDLMEVTEALIVEMMRIGEIETDASLALSQIRKAIRSGLALRVFEDLIDAQGGDSRVIEDFDLLPLTRESMVLRYDGACEVFVEQIDALKVGESARLLGAGRAHADAQIDLSVGIYLHKKVGSTVTLGEAYATIYFSPTSDLDSAIHRLRSAYSFSPTPVEVPSIIIDRILSS